MSAREALIRFLSVALRPNRRQRFVEFASKAGTQDKFLNALWHDLIDEFDPRYTVDALSEQIWEAPAYLFSAYDDFGSEYASLREAAEACPDGFLAITTSGQHGIHREEATHDTQRFVALPKAAV